MSSIKCHLILNITLLIMLLNGTAYSFNSTFTTTTTNKLDENKSTTTSSSIDDENHFVRNLVLSLLCIPIIVATLIGNMLVVLAVIIVRKLHTQDNANNFLIVSLALSDFLVGVLVMPFAFYVEISDENK